MTLELTRPRRWIALESLHLRRAVLVAFVLAIPSLYALHLWLDFRVAWVHAEAFASSSYIWNSPLNESFTDRLRKALDWKAFDPNVNRVRPLNDLADTIDTISRPLLAEFFEPHPSMTPTAIVTAIVVPWLLFLYLRMAGVEEPHAAGLLAVFISSIGFLSVLIPSIHPAKKLTFLFLALALYFGQRHARTNGVGAYVGCLVCLWLGFFADEMGLAAYAFVALLIPSLVLIAPTWKRVTYLLLPFVFLVTIKWLLPWLYVTFSVHGAWDALADAKKFEIARYLLEPNFYRVGAIHIATLLLTTVGVGAHDPVTEGVAFAALVGGTALMVRPWRTSLRDPVRYRLVASALAVIAGGVWATLLDWYPFPEEVSYLGAFTFYYHSSLNVLVVIWLAFVWQRAFQLASGRLPQLRQGMLAAGAVVCGVITIANFQLFQNINEVVQLLHTYPYSTAELHAQIFANLPQIRSASPGEVVQVKFVKDPAGIDQSFAAAARTAFGSDWQDNDFYRTFTALHATPIMTDDDPGALLHAYYPYVSFSVEIDLPSGERVKVYRPMGAPEPLESRLPKAPRLPDLAAPSGA